MALVAPTNDRLTQRQADNGGMAVRTGFLGDDTSRLAHKGQHIIRGEGNHQNLAGLELFGGLGGTAADTDLALGVVLADTDTGEQGIAHHMHLNHIRGARDAHRDTGGNNDQVTILHETCIAGLLYRFADQFIGGGGVVHQQRGHTAVHVQLAAGRLVEHAAIIWVSGRKRLSRRAVSPLLEAVIIAEAPMSAAVVQAAWPTAALTFRRRNPHGCGEPDCQSWSQPRWSRQS